MNGLLMSQIGSSRAIDIPGWPTRDLGGVFQALERWPLDRRLDLSHKPEYRGIPGVAPFRGLAWGHCVREYSFTLGRYVHRGTKPIYPDYPHAVRYVGNFVGYSFPFWLDTADQELIQRLDDAIARNLSRQGEAVHA